MIKTLAAFYFLINFAYSAVLDQERIGIDRIDERPSTYNYFVNHGSGWWTGFGYHSIRVDQTDTPNGAKHFQSFAGIPGHIPYIPSDQLMPRTITNDIRRSHLDKEIFDTHLAEGSYGVAWRMSKVHFGNVKPLHEPKQILKNLCVVQFLKKM